MDSNGPQTTARMARTGCQTMVGVLAGTGWGITATEGSAWMLPGGETACLWWGMTLKRFGAPWGAAP